MASNPNLLEAVIKCDEERVKLLINAGINVNAYNERGRTVLHQLISRLYTEKCEDDLKKIKDGIQILVKNGADINKKTSSEEPDYTTYAGPTHIGETPLHYLIQENCFARDEEDYNRYIEIASLLIELGADLTKQDKKGRTAIELAEQKSNKNPSYDCMAEILKLLNNFQAGPSAPFIKG